MNIVHYRECPPPSPGAVHDIALDEMIFTIARYGFPPRELHPPDEGHEEDPVPLQHGDRVMVEHLQPIVPEEQHPPDVVMSELKAQGGEGSAPSVAEGSVAEAKTNQQRQGLHVAI